MLFEWVKYAVAVVGVGCVVEEGHCGRFCVQEERQRRNSAEQRGIGAMGGVRVGMDCAPGFRDQVGKSEDGEWQNSRCDGNGCERRSVDCHWYEEDQSVVGCKEGGIRSSRWKKPIWLCREELGHQV